jgi:hypothetical protein
MTFHISKKSIVAKGCEFHLYALKFIGVSNCSRVPGNRSKIQHQLTVLEKGIVSLRTHHLSNLNAHEKNHHEENEVYNQYLHPDV